MNHSLKVAYHTLGCKLNFSETSTLARQFNEAGYARVELDDAPDVLVVNTCSVTEEADKKCRNIIHRVIRKNPDTYVAVVGCYAQLKPQEIANMEGVNLVLGAGEKFNLVTHVEQFMAEKSRGLHNGVYHSAKPKTIVGEIKDVKDFVPSFSSGDRTRTFLKVQDGCNYFCAFCTIPLARGRSRSANISQTIEQAKKAIAAGAKEIVLTGVNIGDFGTAHKETFLQLITALDELQDIERFRISSIEPNLLTDEIISFVASSKKFMPHFHIPLQSGSDDVLSAMRRRYRTALYRSRIETIKTLMPHACIGVDVITGFPGEDEQRFTETREFILSLPVSYLHVFTYSERPHTTALRIQEVVPMEVRHKRTKMLRLISEKKKRAFYQEYVGTTRPVLFESETDDNLIHGFTDNYIKVTSAFHPELINSIVPTDLIAMNADGEMKGESLQPVSFDALNQKEFTNH